MSGIQPISGRARPNQLATLKQCYSELRGRGAGDGVNFALLFGNH